MSKIYQPPESPFSPLYQDCLENALMRQFLNFSTQSVTPVLFKDIPLVANLFDTPGKRLVIEAEGIFISNGGGSAAGLNVSFDGVAIPALTMLVGNFATTGTPSMELNIKIFRRLTELAILYNVTIRPTQATNNIATPLVLNTVLSNVDFTIPHTLSLFANVGNALNTLTLGALSAHVV